MNLIKSNSSLMNTDYKGNKDESLLRQYELLVKSSEDVSSKRMTTNRFYLIANTSLFAISGYLSLLSKPLVAIILSIMGIFLSMSWISNLASYKRLNRAKFKVIHELEEHLPARIFSKEDEYLNSFYTLTKLECYIPYLFVALYILIIIIFLPSMIGNLIHNLNWEVKI